jgi:hypothetical protein
MVNKTVPLGVHEKARDRVERSFHNLGVDAAATPSLETT